MHTADEIIHPAPPLEDSLQAAIERACSRIAPTWPLDRFIAVNPYWGHIERPIAAAAAQLATLLGSPMLMSRKVPLAVASRLRESRALAVSHCQC